jgi:F0F1-type ATP synthase membrane subunit b/b'
MLGIPDKTFLIQIAFFVALWFLLKRLWFDPATRVISERARRSEGAVAEARKIRAEAEALRRQHEAALDQARREAQRELEDVMRAAEAEQKRMIAEAREEAQRTLGEVRARLAEEVAVARRGLRDAAGELAQLVTQRVLGRPA